MSKKTRQQLPNWTREYVGMIHYSSYWGKYSLVLNVDGYRVTELDGFADINQHPSHAKVRSHCTPPDRRDKFLTVAEYYSQIIENKPSATGNNIKWRNIPG